MASHFFVSHKEVIIEVKYLAYFKYSITKEKYILLIQFKVSINAYIIAEFPFLSSSTIRKYFQP